MNFIDTHSHIYFDQFKDDLEEVIERAKKAGVEKIIAPSTSPKDFSEPIKLAEKYDNVYAAVGTHPYDAHLMTEKDFQKIRELASHPKVVAIGEMGLDFHYEGSQVEAQKESFEKQILIAKEFSLPVIVHCRMAKDAVLELLEKHRPKGVIHCFSEDIDYARKIFGLGILISFTGVMTYESSRKIQEAVTKGDLDKMMIETDAPFLKPGKKRTEDRCEPEDVIEVAKKMAELRGVSLEEVARVTTENAKKLFQKLV